MKQVDNKQNASLDFSRRRFLQVAAGASTAFTILPRHVLGGGGFKAPSEKLNIAGIGAAGMAAVDLKNVSGENIVALCDVDWKHAAETFQLYPQAEKFKDFREMLEKRKDIDAVVVATPDHIHAPASMMAIKMGKHVYCEKPLTHTVYEARRVAEEARKAGVATQLGNQGHSGEGIRLICEWIWDGAIGQVRQVEAWTTHAVWPQGLDRPKETPPVPDTLDWDLWLGPAPQRPYHPAYLPMLWRGWLDFGTGAAGDAVCHILDPVFTALKLGHPESVEASCSYFVPVVTWDKTFNKESYPQASLLRYEFPRRGDLPPLELNWYDGGLMPRRPKELEENRRMGDQYGGVIFIGDKGKLMCGCYGDNPRLIPETRMQEYKRPPKTLPRLAGHHQDWLQACKGGQPAGSNFSYGGLLTETALIGNVALRVRKKLLWDGPNLKFTNAPEANDYLHYEYRNGWTL
jgi:hypothetical protein